ncbi:F-box protein At5g03100-like [Rutidosis leptorrhynchoides]|uniref:F-box protein At5g03100-like n=1 Tax=Rutidosis leptorrhynchoides TaxID=125765 RepID=UPI003A9A1907
MNAKCDRLSNLSEDLIIQILSFNDTKQAVRTSILSSRWRNIWKSIPHLDLSSEDFTKLNRFYEFTHDVSNVISSRNNDRDLSSVKLSVRGYNQTFVKTVVDYALSHNVQKMTIIWFDDRDIELPNSLFMSNSRSLKELTLIAPNRRWDQPKIKSSWDLPALTTLHLENVYLSNKTLDEHSGLFSKCLNLKNLTLSHCTISDHHILSHSKFSNLTPEKGLYSVATIVAPHLKNLTAIDCSGRLKIYTPELSSLMYKVPSYDTFFLNGVSCLEKVDFYMCPFEEDTYAVIEILQKFHNVKYLTLGLEVVELLSSMVDMLSDLSSPFSKLKSLKIYPMREEGDEEVNIPTELKNFLLGASPNATVSIYSREDVKALKDATSAKRIMAKLQVLLEREKINCEQGEAKQIDEGQLVEDEISHMRNCWTDMFVEINEERVKIDEILLMLDEIKELLKGLPISKRDGIQAQFSSLNAEAKNVMKLILDRLKVKSGGKVSAFVNML